MIQLRPGDDLPATAGKPDALALAVSIHQAARVVDAMAMFVRSCVRLVGAVAALAAAMAVLCIIAGTLW